jgi:hypothetical protein
MEDAAQVRAGDQLTVIYYDFPSPGQVKWVQRDPQAKLVRLGICWVTKGSAGRSENRNLGKGN